MSRTLKHIWHETPNDAARIIIVMALMPILFWLYQLGWDQQSARALFSGSLGILGWLVGALIEERKRLLGFAVSTCAIASAVAAIGALIVLVAGWLVQRRRHRREVGVPGRGPAE